jgi:hypothetical protein
MVKMTNYIYLLQEREFIKTEENIFKIGKTTKNNLQRFSQYPKGSKLLYQFVCDDCHTTENILLEIFKKEFKQRTDIGREYFEGDYKIMGDTIYENIRKTTYIKEHILEKMKETGIELRESLNSFENHKYEYNIYWISFFDYFNYVVNSVEKLEKKGCKIDGKSIIDIFKIFSDLRMVKINCNE